MSRRPTSLLRFIATSLLLVMADVLCAQIRINEVCAANAGEISDDDSDPEDWIELYNSSGATIDLTGYFISDDPDNPYKWLFPESQISGGEKLLIWASGKDGVISDELHTNFKLDVNGEPVILTNPGGQTEDYFPAVQLGGGYSFGLQPDGSGTYRFFIAPTPGESNDGAAAFTQYLSPPMLFSPPGQYNQDFDLFIEHDEAGTALHYTLDGSKPTQDSPLYTDPLYIYDRQNEPDQISAIPTTPPTVPEWYRWYPPLSTVYKGTSIRVRAFKDGAIASPIVGGFYIVDSEVDDRYELPVMSLTLPEHYLFGSSGIYSQYTQSGPSWERLAHLAYYDPDGTLQFSTNIGLRLHGNNSRRYALKSFRIYFREKYGLSSLNYDLFPGSGIMNHERLILRHSGSDWSRTYFRDAVLQQLLKGYADVDYQNYQPVVTFVNGEYWGIMNLRERLDDNYILHRYGYERHEIDMLVDKFSTVYGSSAHYLNLRAFWENNDLGEPENYEYVKTQMDVVDFRDYHVLQIYCMNIDQPGKNVRFWRPKKPGGKWRWLLLDMDDSFSYADHCEYDRNGLVFCSGLDSISATSVNPKSDWPDWAPNSPARTLPLRALLGSEEFRNDFILRFADLLNTAFLPERLNEILDEADERIAPYMQEHYERWHRPEPGVRTEHVDRMRNFANLRKAVMEEDIVNFFELSGSYDLTVNVQPSGAGHIKVNSILIHPDSVFLLNDEVYPWTGKYYSGVELPIAAKAAPGYVFSHWLETGGTNDTLFINPGEDVIYTAVFEPVPVAEPIHFWSFNSSGETNTPYFTVGGGGLDVLAEEFTIQNNSGSGFSGENARFGVEPGSHLVVDQAAGTTLILEVPTEDFHSPKLSYEARSTTAGAGIHRVFFSTDGVTYTLMDSVIIYDDSPRVYSVDFSAIAGVADNTDFRIKIELVKGEGGLIGDNIFDNIAVDAIPMAGDNLPPGMEGPLHRLKLIAGDAPQVIDLNELFTDPDGDPLEFQLSGVEGGAFSVNLTQSDLSVTAEETGAGRFVLSVSDGIHQPVLLPVDVLVYPAPAQITQINGFEFSNWAEDQPAGSFPANMIFLQGSTADPTINTPLRYAYHIPADDYNFEDITTIGFPYNNTTGTRINGLEESGVSFVNTGKQRDVGGAVVAVNTMGVDVPIYLEWTAGTMVPHSRKYNIRVQYRFDINDDFEDLMVNDQPVEYLWNPVGNQHLHFDPVALPESFQNRPYIQFLWKYYYTGEQVLASSGKRAVLRLDDIAIGTAEFVTAIHEAENPMLSVYPNPVSAFLTVENFYDEVLSGAVFSLSGKNLMDLRNIQNRYTLDLSTLSPGMYTLQLFSENGSIRERKKIIVIR